jgi:hypothetical protein
MFPHPERAFDDGAANFERQRYPAFRDNPAGKVSFHFGLKAANNLALNRAHYLCLVRFFPLAARKHPTKNQ